MLRLARDGISKPGLSARLTALIACGNGTGSPFPAVSDPLIGEANGDCNNFVCKEAGLVFILSDCVRGPGGFSKDGKMDFTEG